MSAPEYRDVARIRSALEINAAGGAAVNASALLEMLDAAPPAPGVGSLREAGDALAAFVYDLDAMPVWTEDAWAELCRLAGAWRSAVQAAVPAPAAPADEQREEAARRLRLAADWCRSQRGWLGSELALRDLAEEVTDRNEHDSMPVVRAIVGGPVSSGQARSAPDLPAVLSSVDDVAKVAAAYGLTERSDGPGWVLWRDPDATAVVCCYANPQVGRVAVAGKAATDVYRPVSRDTVVAAIEAARGEQR